MWQFPEVDKCQHLIGLSNAKILTMDPGYKTSNTNEQENWAYKNVDFVYGFPSLVRFAHRKAKAILQSQCLIS